MEPTFTVPLSEIIKELALETEYTPCDTKEILISSRDVTRPGLELTGFMEFFDPQRIILFGNTETGFLNKYGSEQKFHVLERLCKLKPPAIIVTRNLQPFDELMKASKMHGVPILRSSDTTSALSAALVSYLNVQLAPRVTRHGVLVEVYGEGILLIGDSGVGKSETAIELIKRGHRLIADDAVEIRRVSSKSLVGSSPENIRHFIELRGVGIINARRIFGMGAVKLTEKIDIVINMEAWDSSKVYDRMGIDNEYTEILGIDVPVLTIPVKPGRNTAVIIEVAAMNNRQKKMGYNAAQELLQSLGMEVETDESSGKTNINWL
ncbi:MULTISPECIES: HPr(Ser) kinase/phosphatase [unclassified Ruminococcus]|uniref:HPr(Ser) kinase/phosphatase n=1 Tax=unclassified Ruminococcus TaxID=2608920 RepID=UPI00210E2850|nr:MULTISPECIES: HPr(Ser) kinase/phosphatase [unclassified Ruminococcus]MCQ4022243.1 HPr(Ser) kinase/phosphatase [Ruminococcus sp. zg-924]MCQ4114571.1 HPr(Ser) kinase/phosphatase [Ruminococcus sp. zg-921]